MVMCVTMQGPVNTTLKGLIIDSREDIYYHAITDYDIGILRRISSIELLGRLSYPSAKADIGKSHPHSFIPIVIFTSKTIAILQPL